MLVLCFMDETRNNAGCNYNLILGCNMLTRREVEKHEILLFDAFENIGIDHVQDILRLDLDTLREFHSYLGGYISRLEREELNSKSNLNK